MESGLSAERVNIDDLNIFKSWTLDVPAEIAPGKESELANISNPLGYYGSPRMNSSSYEEFLDSVNQQNDQTQKFYEEDGEEWTEDPDRLHLLVKDLIPAGTPLPTRVYTLHNYPLSRDVYSRFELDQTHFKSDKLTLGHLLYIYTLAYQEIYNQEDDAVVENGKVVKNIPGMANRERTEGPFEIWGHSIGDLDYNGSGSVVVFTDSDDQTAILCEFDCDS